jgi:hypothetical protein
MLVNWHFFFRWDFYINFDNMQVTVICQIAMFV